MISKGYMEKIGLTEDQISLLMDIQEKESKYRRILESEHCIRTEGIIRLTDMESLDLSDEDLIREKIRIEYEDMIPKQYRSG